VIVEYQNSEFLRCVMYTNIFSLSMFISIFRESERPTISRVIRNVLHESM